jgi:hypothetical protein
VSRTESKFQLATWLPILISVAALLVSLGALYFDHWREAHSLRAVIAEINWGERPTPVEIVVRNLGNKTEVLKDARLIWSKVDTGGGQVSKEHIGPVVIKADESVVQTFAAALPTFEELRDSNLLDQENGLHVGVLFSILDFRSPAIGSKIYVEKTIPFTVVYFDKAGRVTGSKPTTEGVESFVDLYSGSSVE